jgi:hypothetical protein
MTGGELALVVAVVLCALAFAALVLVLARLLQALRALEAGVAEVRGALDRFGAETRPLVSELRDSVEEARDDLDRFDAVLGSAEAIATRVEGATRVARVALSKPVIKTVALASGTQRAARRLRRSGP